VRQNRDKTEAQSFVYVSMVFSACCWFAQVDEKTMKDGKRASWAATGIRFRVAQKDVTGE
jgi:hypothetical protein